MERHCRRPCLPARRPRGASRRQPFVAGLPSDPDPADHRVATRGWSGTLEKATGRTTSPVPTPSTSSPSARPTRAARRWVRCCYGRGSQSGLATEVTVGSAGHGGWGPASLMSEWVNAGIFAAELLGGTSAGLNSPTRRIHRAVAHRRGAEPTGSWSAAVSTRGRRGGRCASAPRACRRSGRGATRRS